MCYTILKNIKTTRLIRGLKQIDIAKKLNISVPSYSRFERGITKTDYHLLKKVCVILNIEFNEIENENLDFVNEDFIPYNEILISKDKQIDEINSQVKLLIKILTEQQETNQLLLKKLKSFSLEKSKG